MIQMTEEELKTLGMGILSDLNNKVFSRVFDYLAVFPDKRNQINPAFPFPKQVNINIIDGYLIIECIGPEQENEEEIKATFNHQPSQTITEFFEIYQDNTKTPCLPCVGNMSNTNFFFGNALEYLCDYFYDFYSIHADFVLNGMIDFNSIKKPTAFNNCTFFYTDQTDTLKIRHIDFMEIWPFLKDDTKEGILYHDEDSYPTLAKYIIETTRPPYDVKLHKILNDFIELISLESTIETDITTFIECHPELLQLAFGFKQLNPQKILKWQDRSGIPDLKPDFLPEDMSGYCNILDFKLPRLKSKPIVGKVNREQPSFEIDSCVAQLEKYDEYCSQHVHQEWLEKEYNIKINTPRKYIIIGHSKDFSPDDRQRLRKNRDTTFFTYDEFIEMTRYQLYRFK